MIEYISKLPDKDQLKIFDYIKNLENFSDFRQEPYSRQLKNKLREFKIDYSKNRHRFIYFFNIGKVIILLHAFKKKPRKLRLNKLEKQRNTCENI